MISAKKNEPEWMTEWRLESFRIWQKMTEPTWANIKYEQPDFQAIKYYAAPKVKPELASLDEVDPELLKTFAKLGINIEEQKRLSGVAVDIVACCDHQIFSNQPSCTHSPYSIRILAGSEHALDLDDGWKSKEGR